MNKLLDSDTGFKIFVGTAATFCTVFNLCNTPDIGLFYSNYWAGALTSAALFICLDDDD